MPRDGQMRSAVLSTPMTNEALVASARNMASLPDAERRTAMRSEDWQSTAWNFYNIVPEYRYAVAWVGNLYSKAKLMILENGKPLDAKQNPNHPALVALASLFGGAEGQNEMLRLLGIHFTVAGEAYIIAAENDQEIDDWMVIASTEINHTAGQTKWQVDGLRDFESPLVIRLWKPHPQKITKSDAPTRAVLGILAQLDGLAQRVEAEIESRLTSAGILLVPSEISFGSMTATTGDGSAAVMSTQASASDFVRELIETARLSLTNRESAAARVPIVMQVAGDFVDKIKHLTLWSELDEHSPKLLEDARNRLALGMDMPPEVLTGTGELNHWNSWQVEEAAIKAHTGPGLAVVATALTTGYLRPFLEGEEGVDPSLYSIGIDDTEMRLRPNRSAEAMELYDRGIISSEALLRENGFHEDDAMLEQERIEWLIRKVAQGSTTPELVAAALQYLSVKLSPSPSSGGRTTEARPTPSLEEHPRRELPEVDAQTAAASLIVERALERAGNRLKTRLGGRRIAGTTAFNIHQYVQADEAELDALLDGAWGSCEMVAGLYGETPKAFTAKLSSYTRGLILGQHPHSPQRLAEYLDLTEELTNG